MSVATPSIRGLLAGLCIVASLNLLIEAYGDPTNRLDRFRYINQEDSGTKYCGESISNILSEICSGKYESPQYKKSFPGYPHRSDDDHLYAVYSLPFRAKAKALSIISGNKYARFKRGIKDECCNKGCTFDELRSYCGA